MHLVLRATKIPGDTLVFNPCWMAEEAVVCQRIMVVAAAAAVKTREALSDKE